MADSWAPFSCRAAATTCDITPEVGIHLHNWSYSPHQVSTGVHEPLIATVVSIIPDDGEPAVIVSLDLGWWMEASDEAALRQAILDQCELEPSHLIVALSHTHSGPSICRSDIAAAGGNLIAPFLDRIASLVAVAAREVVAAAVPALLEWTTASCTLAANRDLWLAGEQRYVVGTNDSVDADDTLLVGRLTAVGDGSSIATICNYAVHLTSLGGGNSLLSPDLLGAARRLVTGHTGAPMLFLQGASGDLAPRIQYASEPSVADTNGMVLGHSVLSALLVMDPPGRELTLDAIIESGAPLAMHAWTRREPTKQASFAVQSITLATQSNVPAPAPIEIMRDRLVRAQRVGSNVSAGTSEFPITVWELGDLVIFAYPGEAYSLLQQTMRSRFPERPLVFVNLANGPHQGYLAPDHAYDDGRYPAWQSPIARGGFEQLATFCIDYLSALGPPRLS